MPAKKRPTPQDAVTAGQILLDGLAEAAQLGGFARVCHSSWERLVTASAV